jgi:hypothetical protein
VGAGTLAVWTVLGLRSDRLLRDRITSVGVVVASLAVTLVNPYGLELWRFLRETVAFGRDSIADWQPVVRDHVLLGLWVLVAAVAAAALVVSIARRKVDVQGAAVVLMFGLGSFRVSRLLSFFVLSVVMLIAPEVLSMLRRRAPARHERPTISWVPAAVFLLALALIGTGVSASARNISCIRFDDDLFPEAQAAGVLTAGGARGRVLTYFDYGEYAIWHLSPDLLVSMDGRRETVYSDGVVERQFRFYTEPGDRRTIVNELHPDYIWMPSSLDVTKDLAADGWKPIYSGPRSVILSQGTFVVPPHQSDTSPRCFPGP